MSELGRLEGWNRRQKFTIFTKLELRKLLNCNNNIHMQVAVYLDVNRVCLIGQGFNRASCLAGKWYFKHTEHIHLYNR